MSTCFHSAAAKEVLFRLRLMHPEITIVWADSAKMLQLLRFGCSYQVIGDTTCSATTIRNRRDEWIRLGVFAKFKQIAQESYDGIVGLVLDQIAIDGSITKARRSSRPPPTSRRSGSRGVQRSLAAIPPLRIRRIPRHSVRIWHGVSEEVQTTNKPQVLDLWLFSPAKIYRCAATWRR